MSSQTLCPLLTGLLVLLLMSCRGSSDIPDMFLIRNMICNYFLPFCELPFHSVGYPLTPPKFWGHLVFVYSFHLALPLKKRMKKQLFPVLWKHTGLFLCSNDSLFADTETCIPYNILMSQIFFFSPQPFQICKSFPACEPHKDKQPIVLEELPHTHSDQLMQEDLSSVTCNCNKFTTKADEISDSLLRFAHRVERAQH